MLGINSNMGTVRSTHVLTENVKSFCNSATRRLKSFCNSSTERLKSFCNCANFDNKPPPQWRVRGRGI